MEFRIEGQNFHVYNEDEGGELLKYFACYYCSEQYTSFVFICSSVFCGLANV
jgi:hypothetical protein